MHLTSTFLSFTAVCYVFGVPFNNDTAKSIITSRLDASIKRDVSDLPTADVTCAGGVQNGQSYGSKAFNDFQVEDAVQQGLDDLANGNMNGNVTHFLTSILPIRTPLTLY